MMLLLLAPALVTAATFRAGGAAVVHKSSLVASAEYPTDPEGLSHMGVVARRSWYELRVGTLTLAPNPNPDPNPDPNPNPSPSRPGCATARATLTPGADSHDLLARAAIMAHSRRARPRHRPTDRPQP